MRSIELKKLILLVALASFTMGGTLSALNPSKIDPMLMDQMNNIAYLDTQDITYVVELEGVSGMTLQNFGGNKAAFKNALREMHQGARNKLDSVLGQLEQQGDIKSVKPLWIANYAIVVGSAESVALVSDVANVMHIYYNHVFELPKTETQEAPAAAKYTYGLEKIDVPGAWKQGYKGQGIVVGLLDTGVDSTHPDLKGKILKFKNFTTDVGSNNGFDGQGHGSHCAGTILGGDKGGTFIGVAPKAKLVMGKIFTASGRTTLAWILEAMQWVADPDGNLNTDDTPQVCSNSWGGGQGSMDKEKPMWEIVTKWKQLGMVPVFANGNSGPNPSTTGTPGGYPHSFAVGATNSSDGIAYFSSRGPITWEGKKYIKPDVSAPGYGILSVKDGGGYKSLSGTSMACPHVSGVCAVVLSANPNLSVDQVIKIIEETSQDLGEAGKDNTFGVGRVNVSKAVEKALSMKN